MPERSNILKSLTNLQCCGILNIRNLREDIQMEKIKMNTPIVEMEGDEITIVIWKMIKDNLLSPYI